MATPTTFAPVVTNPGGTGTTITPTLPSGHAAGDVIEIWVGNTGIIAWTAPVGWLIKQQTASSGNASTGVRGTLLYRKVLPGDSLPLASPVCNLGATVTRGAIAFCKRGADLEGVHTLPEWLAFGAGNGSSNPIRPPSTTTRSPETLVTHYYVQRSATNAPEPTGYTQTGEIVISGTMVINVSEKNVADQQTVLANQDASPTSGVRWVGMISCTPNPDYPYYRASASHGVANAMHVTPSPPTGTTASDLNGNADLMIATVEAAGNAIAIAPNTPADWTEITGFAGNTSGDGTTVRKYWAHYTGISLDRRFNRPTNGELSAYINTYRNTHQTAPLGVVNKRQNASSTTSTWDAITRQSTKVTMNVTCVADAVPSFTSPTGWTERMDGLGMTCADQSFNATGSTASASFTLSTASPTLVGLIEIIGFASSSPTSVIPTTISLTLTAFAPKLQINLIPSAQALVLSSFAPALKVSLIPATQALTLTTFAPTLSVSAALVPATASLSLTSFAVQLKETITPSTTLLSLATFAPTVTVQTIVVPTTIALTTSQFAPQLVLSVTPATSALTTASFAPVLKESTVPSAGSLNLSTFAPTVSISNNVTVTPSTLSLSLSTFAVALRLNVIPSTQPLTLTTFAPTPNSNVTVVPSTRSLSLTTFAPVLAVDITVIPSTASLSVTSFAPSLTVAVVPAPASLTTTTFAPTLLVSVSVVPSTLNLTITTFAPDLAGGTVTLIPSTSNLVLTTYAPSRLIFIPRSGENISREIRNIDVSASVRSIPISHEERAN